MCPISGNKSYLAGQATHVKKTHFVFTSHYFLSWDVWFLLTANSIVCKNSLSLAVMNTTRPDEIYKIATVAAFANANAAGRFEGMPLDLKDGYIHFSDATQLSETLRLHFKGQRDLVLLAVRTATLGEALRWEPSRGGALFPHLYGALPLDLIVWSAPIAVDATGNCPLPAPLG